MYQKKERGAKPWVIMACVVAAFIWLLYALGNVLTPFIVAAVLAYVLNPLVEWLQLKRIRRAPASMIVMVLALQILLALVLIIVPMLLNQFNNLAERLPQIVGFVQNKLLPWLNSVSGDYIQIDQESIIAWLQSHTDELSNTLKEWIPTLMRQSGNVISGVSNLVLLPLLLYYFLLDWKRWSSGISKIGSAPFYRDLHAYQWQYGRSLRRVSARPADGYDDYGLGLWLGLDASRFGFRLCHRHDCRYFGIYSIFGCIYRPFAGDSCRAFTIWLMAGLVDGLGCIRCRTILGKLFHYT